MSNELWDLGLRTIRELETDQGILASSRTEIYGCIFGRDSLITGLKLLRAYERTKDEYFLILVRKILVNLARLQGKERNIESGEEPGKIIHEFRESGHEHLTARAERPWYVYPDGTMKNYDSVDATPLFLICVHYYLELSGDKALLSELENAVKASLNWLLASAESHPFGFVSYHFLPERVYGGLATQSWMDSTESIFHEDGSPTPYPISPAEVQSYAHIALCRWERHFRGSDSILSLRLKRAAERMKTEFNKRFVENGSEFNIAFALDGEGKPMTSARSSVGHLLWLALGDGYRNDSVLEAIFVPKLRHRLFEPDLFVPGAGLQTLSSRSAYYDPASYHNGSIWPHDTAMTATGLADFGYADDAEVLTKSLCDVWEHFQTPVELFTSTEAGLGEYRSATGQEACKSQAWSAASILALYIPAKIAA